MRYFSPEEIKKTNRAEVKNSLRHHIGKNLQDQFAVNLTKRCLADFGWDRDNAILDLGPASGVFARQIHNFDHLRIFGVDIDNYLADENRSLFTEFKTADLSFEPIPWPDNFFNLVTAWCVLPHLENPFQAIREIRRVLKPGGIFIFTAPNLSSRASADYFTKHCDFGSYHKDNNHLVVFTRSLIEKTILEHFDLLAAEYPIRGKILNRGAKGLLRKTIYNLAKKISPGLRLLLEKRWAYNAAYVLKKKDLSDNTN